jgi:hypothetical protein
MANNFSSTLSELLFLNQAHSPNTIPKEISTTTPAFNLSLAQTLGHFHTLLAPPKAKVKKPKPPTKHKPSPHKKKSFPPASSRSGSLTKPQPTTHMAKSGSKPVTPVNTVKSETENETEKVEISNKDEEEEFSDELSESSGGEREDSDTEGGVNLDFSVSDLEEEDEEDQNLTTTDLQQTESTMHVLHLQKKDESVDMIAEFVINKM